MVHQYKLNGYNIVLDTCSGAVHVVDEVAYDMIAAFEEKSEEAWKYILAAEHHDVTICGLLDLSRRFIPTSLNASAFVELVRTKILTPSQLKPFAKFYRKLFYPNKLYSGGFKSVAKLYIALVQGGTFNLDNEEHCKVFTSFDWENPAIHPLTHCKGAAGYQPLVDMLVQRWKESGFDA